MRRLLLIALLFATPAWAQNPVSYLQIPPAAADPFTCNSTRYGAVYRNTVGDIEWVCRSTGWQKWGTSATPGFPLLAPDGSVAAPSYSFSAGTSTGMYRESSGLGSMLGLSAVGASWLALGAGATNPFWQLGPTAGVTGKNPGISIITAMSAAAGDTNIQGGRLEVNAGTGTGDGSVGGLGIGSLIRVRVPGYLAPGTTAQTLQTIASFYGRRWTIGGEDGVPFSTVSGGVAPATSYVLGLASAGTDISGGGIQYDAGPGTGNAAVTSHVFRTPTVGASGTTAQTMATRLTIDSIGTATVGDGALSGHVRGTGVAPALSACGTTPAITGSDVAGKVTAGTGATLQSCTLTFATAYVAAPACWANDETEILLLRAVSTITTLTVDCAVAGCLTSDVFSYGCLEGS